MTPLDPDRMLALAYVPAKHCAAIEALWRLDAALGAVLAGGREPLISRIKLAWWRDSLEKLDSERPPAEPVLQAVAVHVLPAIPGERLSALEDPWTALLTQDALTHDDLDRYAVRGRLLFRYSAELLGRSSTAEVERGGEAWALADLSRHSGEPDATASINAARQRLDARRWPPALRPLGMLAALARRDVDRGLARREAQGSPGRMMRMLAHRFTGR